MSPRRLAFALGVTLAVSLTAASTANATPVAAVSPTSLAFEAPLHRTSEPQLVTLANLGTTDLTGISIALIGTNFTLTETSCGAALAPSASCAVSVTFTPTAARAGYAATLRFTGNDPVNPTVDVALSGTGTEPRSDRDEDGVADGSDLCPTRAGALRSGCPSELGAVVDGRWRVNRLYSQLLSLNVRAPVGSRISIRCRSTKPGVCRFRVRVIAATAERTTDLTSRFGPRRIFPAGTVITVRISRPLYTGTYERFVTRTGRRLPRVKTGCLTAGGALQRCV